MVKKPGKKGIPRQLGTKLAVIRHSLGWVLNQDYVSIAFLDTTLQASWLQLATSWAGGEELAIQRAIWSFRMSGHSSAGNYEFAPPFMALVVAWEGSFTNPSYSTSLRTLDDILDNAISGDLQVLQQGPVIFPKQLNVLYNPSTGTWLQESNGQCLMDITAVLQKIVNIIGNPMVTEGDFNFGLVLVFWTIGVASTSTYSVDQSSDVSIDFRVRQKTTKLLLS